MTPPASYSEKTLADFMHGTLGILAELLGLAAGAADAGSYAEAVNSTLLAYGEPDVALAVDIPRLRALARRQAWRMVCEGLAGLYDFSAEGGSYSRSQMLSAARANLHTAEVDALRYEEAYVVL